MKNVHASILDFPRKTLSEDIWQYRATDPNAKEDELPRLKPSVKSLIVSTATKYLSQIGFRLIESHLLGGSASYQWAEGADIDVSLFAEGWPENISQEDIEKYHNFFSKIKIPYRSYEIHFFLRKPDDSDIEVSEAIYDILNNEWLLPPLILPKHFDPDDYFKPFIKEAEVKAKKFDEAIGKLRRSWGDMVNASEAQEDAVEPDLVKKRIQKEKEKIIEVIDWLVKTYKIIRDRRNAMHDAIKEKMEKNVEVGRLARFQEPEIIWKYLERAGYNDFLRTLGKLKKSNQLEKILSNY